MREQGTGERGTGDRPPEAAERRGSMQAASHRELIVWQKPMDLTVMVYGLTRGRGRSCMA
jgi:hypothetical protein